MQKILVLIAMAFVLVACGHKKDAKSFEKILEAQTGHAHSIAKLQTETGKFVVYKDEVTGRFVAYNMDKFDRKNMTSMDQYLAVAVQGQDFVHNLDQLQEWIEDGYYVDVYEYYDEYYEYYDEDCDCYYSGYDTYSVWVGTEWVDTSYWYTYYTGGGFRFENTSSQSKDLETVAALKDEVAQKVVAHKLASEFSLSASRAGELAKLATRYQKLENSRELTDSEKDKFALEALGVSMSQVESALKAKAEGNDKVYAELLSTASQVNKTTPEQIGNFFNEYVTELAE